MTGKNERVEEAEDSPLMSRKLSPLLSQNKRNHRTVAIDRHSSMNCGKGPMGVLGDPEGVR